MTRTLFTFIAFFIISVSASAQDDERKIIDRRTDSIAAEGKTLYLSEIASWHGTDIFLERCKDKLPKIGGYLSYDNGQGMINIFFTKDPMPKVVGTMSFSYDVKPQNCELDTTERKMSAKETELYTIRKIALDELNSGRDTIFKFYQNTGTNAIPVIINGEKRVYVLTSPKANGYIMFGNDYLIRFDKENKITAKKALHKNLISVKYDTAASDTAKNREVAGMHTHLAQSGEYISATDICTLRLYQGFTTWNQYYVMSPTLISIWDCKKNMLLVLTRAAWDKINAHTSSKAPTNDK